MVYSFGPIVIETHTTELVYFTATAMNGNESKNDSNELSKPLKVA